MNTKTIMLLTMLSAAFLAQGQTDWNRFDRLMNEGSYKSAYSLAESVYSKSSASNERLLAAYNMTVAAANYQEDVRDSAEARYRALLPSLNPLERALCHAFLGEYDSALVYSDVLKATPVERIKHFCNAGKTGNMTPTAFDVVVIMMQDRGSLTPRRRVELQQMLCNFHATDPDDGLRIWHDRRLLDFMQAVPNQRINVSTYQLYINKYRGTKSPQLTSLYEGAARRCQALGDLVQAVRYCDTAVSLFPKSEWGVECAKMRSQITAPRIRPSRAVRILAPQREELLGVEYANLDRLHLRLIEEPEKHMSDEHLAKLKALREWTVEVPRPDAYGEASAAFALPALPPGKYRLLVAPTANFAKGMAYAELHVTDIALRYTDDGRGLVMDRTTGAPVAGQKVQLVQPKQYYPKQDERVLQTVVTAADGTYRFDSIPPRNSIIKVVRDGYTIEHSVYKFSESTPDGQSTQFHLVSDRPVYRPGDTVQVAMLLYRTDGREGELLAAGHAFDLVLFDPNGQQVQQLKLTTDDFGSAHCALPLPTDRLAGHWTVQVSDSTGSDMLGLRVEEYKQPRFMVSLSTEGAAPQFGQSYAVQGMAAAYSGVSIGGARVQYTVTRSHRFWRWGPIGTVVAQGETEAAADGTFQVLFTPEPDSSIELSTKPVFNYTVQVTVTDLNGESHDAETTLRVGYQRLFVRLNDVLSDMRELPSVQVELTDVNGTPQQGRVGVSVARLRKPNPMRMAPAVLTKGMIQTIDSADYRRRFPQYIYDMSENDRREWDVESGEWKAESEEREMKLPPLQGGIYRIVAWAMDGQDTVADTAYTVLTPPTDRQSCTDAVLWVDRDKTTAHPGDRVTFRIGSAYKDVKAFYMIEYGEKPTLRSGWLTLGESLQEVTVDVDSAQLGGLTLTVVAMFHGQSFTEDRTVLVPYSHKELKVEIATFRDKLLPGETEEWTIRVESGKRKEESALVMTMYDDALNTYGTPSWRLWSWRSHSTVWQTLYTPYLCWDRYDGRMWHNYNGSYPSVWTLKDALPAYNRWRGRLMYKTASARNAAVVTTELAVVGDDVEEVTLDAVQTSAAGAAMAADEGAEEEDAIFSVVEKEPEPQLRSNLSTLAFFAPALRTDSSGTVTYRFTVPELLTRWNVHGLAVTKDLKSGTFSKTLVTAKPLMVQPNMPRFLRSGDSLSLMAKVVMAEPISAPQEVTVDFLLTDAATGDTLCFHTEQVSVKDAAQVLFDVEVPQHIYVATYKIVAHADGMSDGEQGQVPVVTNRQAVTVSQALYINGAGEKHFEMPQWLNGSATREPLLVAAEVVGNPIWLAVKSMPYLSDLENPSTLYLATQLHINTLGKSILDKLNIADVLDKLNENPDSRLRMNEDVKQTLLQATPWVRDALAEEDQMATMKNYFDHERMEAQLSDLGKQLSERQNADGGWCWMPDGKSSLWVTQQVLQNLKLESGNLKVESEKALKYIDREQQAHYDRYIKPYLKKGYKWEPTDIDYLYTRSFYGKANTEAYKYYYSNALKHYRNCENLYTQAQLALVFFRHGDRKEALDLLRRIKEKALVNDEMGMYWRDNRSSWWWYQRPIETQALLVLAFSEITPDDRETIGLMQQWLLKQKQTTHWGNDCATAHAIEALMQGIEKRNVGFDKQVLPTLNVFGQPVTASATGLEGYRQQRWTGAALDSLRSLASSDIIIRKSDSAIAWGAVYYQFADDMDKIPASDMGITIKRTYLHDGPLHVGDKVRVRVDIQCDRTMEYLELIDGRPSCVEPLNTQAGWRWSDGLSYYITVNQTDTRCYIDRLEKGRYWFEYEVYVTNPGRFMAGPVSIQCMYAPEFRAIDKACIMEVKQ